MDSERRVNHQLLQGFGRRVLERAGLRPENAELVACVLVEADLRGVPTHGVLRLGVYARRLLSGENNPSGRPRVIRDSPACLLMDGDNALGQIVAVRAMGLCMDKARTLGLGVAAVKNSNDFTRGAHYSLMAAEKGLIGFATTNTPALLAPTGGTTPTVGNNPLSIAVPAGREGPIVLDMALSVVAAGKIVQAAREQRKIPLGWLRDALGRDVDDPGQFFEGSQVPLGEYKGFGLALLMEVLAGVLPGALPATRLRTQGLSTRGVGHFFAALDPGVFGSRDAFAARVDDLMDLVKGAAPAQGTERPRVPGERECQCRQRNLREGVPLPDYVWQAIEETARELRIEPPKVLPNYS